MRGGNDQNLLSKNQKSWVMVRNISIQILKSWRSEIFEKCDWGAGNNQKVSIEMLKAKKFQQYYWLNQNSWTMIRNIWTQILKSWFREVWLGRRHDELWPTSTLLAPMHLYFTSLLYCASSFFYTTYLLLLWFSPILYFSSRYFMFSSGVCSEWKGAWLQSEWCARLRSIVMHICYIVM